MPVTDPASWSEHLQQNLQLYEETLLRQVAARLIKPRNQWPADELIRRMVEAAENAAVVDRRLRETTAAGRQLLAMLGHSRKSSWYAGHLIELLAALSHPDPLAEVLALLEGGLLYLDLVGPGETAPGVRSQNRCKSFADWLQHAAPGRLLVCAHPWVTRRAAVEILPLPDLSQADGHGNADPNGRPAGAAAVRETDGLEWLLRLAVVWQQVRGSPLRRTQQGDFFKRDQERLRADTLLCGQPADALAELPDPGLLAVSLAGHAGVLFERDGQLMAGDVPPGAGQTLPEALTTLWLALLQTADWNGARGWDPGQAGNPYPTAYLLCLLLLRQIPEGRWCPAERVAQWVLEHHPFWRVASGLPAKKKDECASGGLSEFLLGLAYSLRLLQACRGDDGEWQVQLSALGRWLLGAGEPGPQPGFPQTLLVQPNLEMLVYRQGLNPDLLARLTRFARWKGLGAACSMQLEPETVYAALEAGETFETILQTLQRHGIKPPPGPVIDSLRTWSQKRDRITVYPAAIILEFLSPEDLTDAQARGVPATQAGPQLAVLAREADIDYRHFRLISNRDYTLPPERCVAVAADGVTLRVDLNRSDLLLESELRRFAAEVEASGSVRVFRLTPDSVRHGRDVGLTLDYLHSWFAGRCDQPLTPAARLLFAGPDSPPATARTLLVVQVASEEIADGLVQWPETGRLVQERLGPTALVIAADQLPLWREKLKELGAEVRAE